jgi:hypothetical protein
LRVESSTFAKDNFERKTRRNMRMEEIHNNKCNNLYPLSYVVKTIKPRKLRCRFKHGKIEVTRIYGLKSLSEKATHGGVN